MTLIHCIDDITGKHDNDNDVYAVDDEDGDKVVITVMLVRLSSQEERKLILTILLYQNTIVTLNGE